MSVVMLKIFSVPTAKNQLASASQLQKLSVNNCKLADQKLMIVE